MGFHLPALVVAAASLLCLSSEERMLSGSWALPPGSVQTLQGRGLQFSVDLSGFRTVIVMDGPYLEQKASVLGTFVAPLPKDAGALDDVLNLYVLVRDAPRFRGKTVKTWEAFAAYTQSMIRDGDHLTSRDATTQQFKGKVLHFSREGQIGLPGGRQPMTMWYWHFESVVNGKWLDVRFSVTMPPGANPPESVFARAQSVLSSISFAKPPRQ
jgi:hypothetical protein